jgi:putative cell wall-binding protein
MLALVLLVAVTPVSVAFGAPSATANLTCVTFSPVTPAIGYAAGAGGVVLKTVDGGATWSGPQTVPDSLWSKTITGIAFWNDTVGIVVTEGRAVYGTVDGGATWVLRTADMTAANLGGPIRLNAVAPVPGTSFRALLAAGDRTPGDDSRLAPQLWQSAESATPGGYWLDGPTFNAEHRIGIPPDGEGWEGEGDFLALDLVSGTHGWAVGVDAWTGNDLDTGVKSLPKPIIARTQNGGTDWSLQPLPVSTATLRGVSFADTNVGVAVGTGGVVFRTASGGGSWILDASGVSSALNGVALQGTTDDGWTVGDGGAIRRTLDGGDTWTGLASPTTVKLTAVAHVAGTTGVAVGDGGTIVRTTDGTTWTTVHPVPDTTPPTTPTGVTATATSPTSIQVAWNASTDTSGIRHYLVFMNGALRATVAAPATSVSVTGLSPSTTYSFYVKAVDNAPATNTSPASSTVQATTPAAPTTLTVVSIAGATRIDTAIEASKQAFAAGSASTVVIATAYNWPDALGGAALAGAYDGPILLTAQASLPPNVMTEIGRLGATKVIILGGVSAVSAGVEAALKASLGQANVTRLAGANRYETSRLTAAAAVERLQARRIWEGTAFAATGANFPDALGASPISAARGWPIYLVNPAAGLDSTLLGAMKAAGVTKVRVLGGPAVVSLAVENSLKASFGAGNVLRLDGANRYDTARAIATYGVNSAGLGWNKVAIATGANFPDALAGGVLQGRSGSVMLLTPTASLDPGVSSTLTANRAVIYEVRFLGGTGAVSTAVRTAVYNLLKK